MKRCPHLILTRPADTYADQRARIPKSRAVHFWVWHPTDQADNTTAQSAPVFARATTRSIPGSLARRCPVARGPARPQAPAAANSASRGWALAQEGFLAK